MNSEPPGSFTYRQNKRSWPAVAIGLALSGMFLYFSLRNVQLSDVWREIRSASIGLLLLTQINKLFGFIFLSLRSSVIFRAVHAYSFGNLFKGLLLAFVGNNILPMRTGEILRAIYLSRLGKQPFTSCLAGVICERMLDLICLLLVASTVLTFGVVKLPVERSIFVLAVVVTLLLAVILSISRNPSRWSGVVGMVSGILGDRLSSFAMQKVDRFALGLGALLSVGSFAIAFLFTLAHWIAIALGFQIWFWAFDLSLPWFAPIVMLLFVSIGLMLPSSPGFVGTYHYFAISALVLFGVNETTAASVAIVGHALATVPFTLIGIAILFDDLVRMARREDADLEGYAP